MVLVVVVGDVVVVGAVAVEVDVDADVVVVVPFTLFGLRGLLVALADFGAPEDFGAPVVFETVVTVVVLGLFVTVVFGDEPLTAGP
jgi:hypothetical protein